MDELSKKLAERQVLIDEVKALFDKSKSGKALEAAELDLIEQKNAKIEALEPEIERLKKIDAIALKNAERHVQSQQVNPDDRPANFALAGGQEQRAQQPDTANLKNIELPIRTLGSTPKNLMRLNSLRNNRAEAQKVAFALGMWALGSFLSPMLEKAGNTQVVAQAQAWCKSNGIVITKAQAENVNTGGGFLVPIILDNYLIELREQFGVVRDIFHRSPMTSDTLTIPRRTSSINAYWLTDNQAIKASQKNFDLVTITANKLAALVLIPSEISEDSIIDIGDNLAKEIAWNFAYMEDNAGINGDGTSAYGSNLGIIPALRVGQGNPTTTSTAGIHVGPANTGSSWSNFLLSDFTATMGLLPEFAYNMGEPAWLTTRQFYETVMVQLLAAAGGNRISDIEGGASKNPRFLGYDVIFSQVMPRVAAATTVPALFGNYDLAAEFGDRKETTLALSTEYAFASDQIAIRGIERFGITIHDVGGSNAASTAINPANTAGTIVAGPVVGLQTYSS